MKPIQPPLPPSIPAEAYTREYYETCCHGYEEFQASHGELLPLRLVIPLELADIQKGMQVVDIGCGRGELILHCARREAYAWGLDYAHEALILARQALSKTLEDDRSARRSLLGLQRANASHLPFANGSVDVVFMLDVVEHLHPHELDTVLGEVIRILRTGGRLIVHTMPNLWYYRYGYPLYRMMQYLRGQSLPVDPRDRWPYAHVHVNEQDPKRLGRTLTLAGFRSRVWLRTTQSYAYEKNRFVRMGMEILTRWVPFRWLFCNDIFAIGTKPGGL